MERGMRRLELEVFDRLLNQFLNQYGENNVKAEIFTIRGTNKSGIIFSRDGKPVQAFTVDANGKKREAIIPRNGKKK